MLKLRNQVKRIIASGGGTLTAAQDQSFMVKAIYCVPSTNDTYLTISVRGTTVGKFRVAGLSGNHLPYPNHLATRAYGATSQSASNPPWNLFDYLSSVGFDMSIPVASGESLTISRYAEAGDVCILYDVYEAADITPVMVNGSMSNTRRYLHYATNAAAITASPVTIATSLMWSGGDGFPFNGSSVPEKNEFRIIGIIGAPASRGNGSANKGYTTHLTLIHRNNVLFDEDRNGIPFRGNVAQTADAAIYTPVASLIGPLTPEYGGEPLIFPEPLVMSEGDKLTTQIVLTGADTGGLAASQIDLAFIMEQVYGS